MIAAVQVTNANNKLEVKFVAVRIHKDDMAVIILWRLFYFNIHLWQVWFTDNKEGENEESYRGCS